MPPCGELCSPWNAKIRSHCRNVRDVRRLCGFAPTCRPTPPVPVCVATKGGEKVTETKNGNLGSEMVREHIDGPIFEHSAIAMAIFYGLEALCVSIEDLTRRIALSRAER